jgi:hypothetical protein
MQRGIHSWVEMVGTTPDMSNAMAAQEGFSYMILE